MSTLTDSLLLAQDTLLASGQEIPATDMRAFTSLLIGAIGTLEARARGNRIITTSGKPGNSLGMEGDLGVNKDNGDVYYFAAGAFQFLWNGTGKVGAFTPIAQNQFGTHPAFTNQDALNDYVLGNTGTGGGTTPTPAKPTIAGFLPIQGAQGSTVVISGTNFTGATLVSINLAVVASFTVDSATQITAVLSATQVTGRVRVTTAAGTGVSATDFTVTATPTSAYMAGQLTDSLGVYRGEGLNSSTDHSLDQTTSTWYFTQARLATGGYTQAYIHDGWPGADIADMLVPGYVNAAEYSVGATAPLASNETPLARFASKFPSTVTPVWIFSLGANNSRGRTPSQMVADLFALADAAKALRPDALIIISQLNNRLDPPEWAGGIPGRASINAAIKAAAGTRYTDYVDISKTPQTSGDLSPGDPKYYQNPDFTGRGQVHRATAGNKIVGQLNYAPILASYMGLTLPALPADVADSISEVFEQNDARLVYVSDGQIETYSPNVAYSGGYGAAFTKLTSTSVSYLQVTLHSYGIGFFTPRSNVGAQEVILQAGDLVSGQFVNGQTVDAGTQYSTAPTNMADPVSEIVSVVYTTKATRTYRLYIGAATAVGQAMFVDLGMTPSASGVFPPLPTLIPTTPIPWQEFISAGNVTITANQAAKTAGADGWNTAVQGFAFTPSATAGEKMRTRCPAAYNPAVISGAIVFGVSDALPTTADFSGIQRAGYFAVGSSGAFESGTQVKNVNAATAGDIYFVVTEKTMALYVGATLFYDFQLVPIVGHTYYLTACLLNQSSRLTNWTYAVG